MAYLRVYPKPTQYKGLLELTCPLCEYFVHADNAGCYEYMLFHTYRKHLPDLEDVTTDNVSE